MKVCSKSIPDGLALCLWVIIMHARSHKHMDTHTHKAPAHTSSCCLKKGHSQIWLWSATWLFWGTWSCPAFLSLLSTLTSTRSLISDCVQVFLFCVAELLLYTVCSAQQVFSGWISLLYPDLSILPIPLKWYQFPLWINPRFQVETWRTDHNHPYHTPTTLTQS